MRAFAFCPPDSRSLICFCTYSVTVLANAIPNLFLKSAAVFFSPAPLPTLLVYLSGMPSFLVTLSNSGIISKLSSPLIEDILKLFSSMTFNVSVKSPYAAILIFILVKSSGCQGSVPNLLNIVSRFGILKTSKSFQQLRQPSNIP